VPPSAQILLLDQQPICSSTSRICAVGANL
jgi:hypothetical protein